MSSRLVSSRLVSSLSLLASRISQSPPTFPSSPSGPAELFQRTRETRKQRKRDREKKRNTERKRDRHREGKKRVKTECFYKRGCYWRSRRTVSAVHSCSLPESYISLHHCRAKCSSGPVWGEESRGCASAGRGDSDFLAPFS